MEEKNRMTNTFGGKDFQFFSRPRRMITKRATLYVSEHRRTEEENKSFSKATHNLNPLSINVSVGTSKANLQYRSNLQNKSKQKYRLSTNYDLNKQNEITGCLNTLANSESRTKSRWEVKDYQHPQEQFLSAQVGSPRNINTYSRFVDSLGFASKNKKLKSIQLASLQFSRNQQNQTARFNSSEKSKSVSRQRYIKSPTIHETYQVKSKMNKQNFLPIRSKQQSFIEHIHKTNSNQFSSVKINDQSYFNKSSSTYFKNLLYDSPRKDSPRFIQQQVTISNQNYLKNSINDSINTYRESKNKNFPPLSSPLRRASSRQQQIKQLCLEDFILGPSRGEGRFGKVFMAIHKATGLLCALKKVKKESVRMMLDQFIQEIKIQLYLNHPKLVKIYGYFCDSENFYMLIEYMEDGSLYSLMKKTKKMQEAEAAQKLNQICQGIKEMHSLNIVHRDLKPQNVVISHGVCKVCDFGWAAVCEDRRQTYCGTLDYVCPQIIQGSAYDSSADIWCIGVMAYELMCGKAPFFDISRKKTIQKIKTCKIQNFPSHLSNKAVNFISMILQKDPNERVGIEQLINSQFLSLSGK